MIAIKQIAELILIVNTIAFTLSSCTFPGIRIYESSYQGEELNVGDTSNFHFFTNDPNFDTGINLQSGSHYVMDITILSYWADSYIEKNGDREQLNESGFANSLMPLEFLALTKRSHDHHWFELMLYQSRCSRDSLHGVTELEVDKDGSYNFVAVCDGELTLFVNDTFGFYSNNIGYASISLSRLN